MRKCIKTHFQQLLTLKDIFFKDMFLVVWKHAKMHQNTFLTTPDVKKSFSRPCFWWSGSMKKCIKKRFRPLQTLKFFFFCVVWKHAQMHQNTFLTTPDTKKYLFQGHVSGGLEA
jgi:hypothetical protein